MSDDNSKRFMLTWKIRHFNFFDKIYCECLSSPAFKVKSLEDSEWRVCLYPRTVSEDLECNLKRLDGENNSKDETIAVNFRYQLASCSGVVLKSSDTFRQEFRKESSSEIYRLMELHDLVKEILKYQEDTLIFRCYLSNNPDTLIDMFKTGCEIETDVSCHAPSYVWSFKFFNIDDWSARRRIKLDDIPLEIIFRYVEDEIHVELVSTVDNDWTHHFTCDIELINALGNQVSSGEGDYEFNKENRNWKFPVFITKQHLEQARCLERKEIRMKFYILRLYSFTSRVSHCSKEDITSSESTILNSDSLSCTSSDSDSLFYYLQHRFQNLSFKETSSDLKLRAENEIFHVHKRLLSEHSSVFSEMLVPDVKKNSGDLVDINDMEAQTLKYILEYLYNGTLENDMNVEIAIDLLIAAERYQVLPLVTKCSTFLEKNLSVINVCRILFTADMINHTFLKSYAVNYIVINASKILSSPEWFYWIERNVHLATEVFLKLSKKFELELKTGQEDC